MISKELCIGSTAVLFRDAGPLAPFNVYQIRLALQKTGLRRKKKNKNKKRVQYTCCIVYTSGAVSFLFLALPPPCPVSPLLFPFFFFKDKEDYI